MIAQHPPALRASPVEREGGVMLAMLAAVVVLLALLPAGRLLLSAAGTLGDPALLRLLAAPTTLRAAWNTLAVGCLSALLALLLGGAMAGILGLTDLRHRRALGVGWVLSMLIAPQVTALAFRVMAGSASPLLNMLHIAPAPGTPNPLLGGAGVILVTGLHHAPLVTIILMAGLKTIPREVVEAAATAGAGAGLILRAILLPLLGPHVVAALALAFTASLGNFGIPAILGMPAGFHTLPTLIFQQLVGNGPKVLDQVAILAALVTVMVLPCMLLAGNVLAGSARPVDLERPLAPFLRPSRSRPLLVALAWGLVALGLLLPLASLLTSALAPTYGARLTLTSATLAHFTEVLWRQEVTLRAFRNSFLLAGGAALLLALLAAPLALALERRAGRLKSLLLALVELPYALPGIVLAIACILIFVRPLPLLGVSLYATPWIILFAYGCRFLPIALKAPLAAVLQQDRAQEEAAALDGAGLLARLRHVIMPGLRPAIAAGALLVFLTAFNELTVSALLWTAGTETLGVVLFSLEEAGLVSEASAVALAASATVALVVLVLDRLASRLPPGTLPWRL